MMRYFVSFSPITCQSQDGLQKWTGDVLTVMSDTDIIGMMREKHPELHRLLASEVLQYYIDNQHAQEVILNFVNQPKGVPHAESQSTENEVRRQQDQEADREGYDAKVNHAYLEGWSKGYDQGYEVGFQEGYEESNKISLKDKELLSKIKAYFA